MAVNDHKVQILGFAGDLNILSESLEGALGLSLALQRAAAKVELRINMEKPK